MESFIFSVLGIIVLIAFCAALGTTVVKAIKDTRFRVPLLSTIVLFFLTLGCIVAVVSTEPNQDHDSTFNNVAQAQADHFNQEKMNHSIEINHDKFNNETYDHDQLLKVTNAKVKKISENEVGNKVVEVVKDTSNSTESYFIIDYDHKLLEEGKTYTFYGKEDLKFDQNSQVHGLNVWKVE